MIKYQFPSSWVQYDRLAIADALTEAKAAVVSLKTIPFQRIWVEKLQNIQLKREVAGTSRIEGADFTESELDVALQESPEQLLTRSQRQAHAAVKTYRWIANLPDDFPLDAELLRNVHRMIVTGADDDHCEPGVIRQRDQNVFFGLPQHRGAEGGDECEQAFAALSEAIQHEFRGHDLLVQALALHYHFGAMHPFLDGNGRTARALEALILQRAGLRDALFIAMSNYYYDEKTGYLQALSDVRARGHDLTSFLTFGLRGIAIQCTRLFTAIRANVLKALYRNMMHELFDRLQTPKRRVIAKRQMQILNILLDTDEEMAWSEFVNKTRPIYASLKQPYNGLVRDFLALLELKALEYRRINSSKAFVKARLEWPTEITETRFFEVVRRMPKAKPHSLGL
jgi:Fic family protein